MASSPQDQSPPAVKQLLGNLAIFGGLGDPALEEIQKILHVHHYPPRAFVVREGDTDKNVYIVRLGEVEVLKSPPDASAPLTRIALLGPGACFGEMSLIDVLPRSASVRTTRETVLLSFSNTDLAHIYQWNLETFTLIMMNLGREVSRRLRRADAILCEFSQPAPRAGDKDGCPLSDSRDHTLPREPI